MKFAKCITMIGLWLGAVVTVSAAGGGVPAEAGAPGNGGPSVPSGLPDTSEGVPAAAGMPVEEPASFPSEGPVDEPLYVPASAPDGIPLDEQSGDAPFDAGQWFDDSMPDYFRPVDARDLDTWMNFYRQSLRELLIKGNDASRAAFMQLLHMVDHEPVRQELLTDLINWAVRSRHHRALVALKQELAEVESTFHDTFSRWMSEESAEVAWARMAKHLTSDWKATLKVVEDGFRERASTGAQQVMGVPSGAALAEVLRRRRRRRRRKSRRNQKKKGSDGDSGSGDSSTEDSESEEKEGEEESFGEDGGGKPAAKP